jgi:hypothetical protein
LAIARCKVLRNDDLEVLQPLQAHESLILWHYDVTASGLYLS